MNGYNFWFIDCFSVFWNVFDFVINYILCGLQGCLVRRCIRYDEIQGMNVLFDAFIWIRGSFFVDCQGFIVFQFFLSCVVLVVFILCFDVFILVRLFVLRFSRRGFFCRFMWSKNIVFGEIWIRSFQELDRILFIESYLFYLESFFFKEFRFGN